MSDSHPRELTLKVVIIGDSGVGKTSVALNYVIGEKPSSNTPPTIAAGFCTAKIRIGNTKIEMLIWDTAGQDAYRTLTKQYYRDSKIVMIMFDVTNINSLKSVKEWYQDVTESNTVPFQTILIGNKIDLPNREVSQEQGESLAAEIHGIYRETSAITGKGVSEVFEDSCEEYIKKFDFPQKIQKSPVLTETDSGCSC